MLRLNGVVGLASDPAIFERLHRLEHEGRVERIRLGSEDAARHRLRIRTDAGTECAIALPRDQRLGNGTVLLLEDDRAVIVALREEEVLKLRPRNAAAALELGYFAGNMHWPVRFQGAELHILLQGPREAYLERLSAMLADGRADAVPP